MKYSQAVIVACVGGAALVSAIPTLNPADADLVARNPTTTPRKSRSSRIGKGLGRAISYGGTFAQSASGGQAQELNRREPTKQKIRKASSSIKRVGSSAIASAGGGQAVVQNLGAVAGMVNNFRQSQNQVQRRDAATGTEPDPEAAAPAADAQAPAAHGGKGGRKGSKASRKSKWQGKSPEEKAKLKAGRKAKKASRRARKSGAAATTPTDATSTPPADASVAARDVDELDARGFFSNLKGNYRQAKADRAQAKADKLAAKVGMPEDPSLAQRDLSDEEFLAMRDLEFDELDARGFVSNLKGNYRQAKADRAQAKADKLAAKVADPALAQRDLLDDEVLALRDLVDILDSREFEEELEARGLRSGWRALKNTVSGKGRGGVPTPDATADPTVAQRDLFEEESLVLRDLDFDELEARGFISNLKGNYRQSRADRAQAKADKLAAKVADPALAQRDLLDEEVLALRDLVDILDSREFEEELDARGVRSGWRALKNTVRGKRPGVPTPDASADPSVSKRDIEDFLESREFEEELEARGIRDGWRALKNTFKGKTPGSSAAAPVDPTLVQRALEYLLESREFEEELEARGILDGFRALKNTLKGKIPSSSAAPVDPTLVQRDLEDFLESREFEEDLEARGLRSGWRALKNTVRGKRPGVPAPDASADPTVAQRDAEDELSARNIADAFRAIGDLFGGNKKKAAAPAAAAPAPAAPAPVEEAPAAAERDVEIDTRGFEINELD
ncbi:hypothetical protein Hypma_002535 [Hypsizygus marmoreus]|uniref:Uncharacterized protein n=1 Tax=Hypsizygus marmoreus TaxID=39966 RepID=A0A369J3S9_HYPMA|nr:hypothetical protein Hypma_002535 [Hypsizygus marmoreus]